MEPTTITDLPEINTVKLKNNITINTLATEFLGQFTSVKIKRGDWGIFVIGNVNCIGVIHDPQLRANYKLQGYFTENKNYNTWDFKFQEYECIIDKAAGLRDYLVREAPAIGNAIALRLVNAFGNDVIKTLASNPGAVTGILSIDKAMQLQEWAKGELSNSSIKEKLYQIGIGKSQVEKLIKAYGNGAEEKLRRDCFSLTEVHGFGFLTVAKIATMIGVPKTDKGRIKAGVLYALNGMLEYHGHTCIEHSELVREASALLELSQEYLNPVIAELLKSKDLISEETDFKQFCLERGIEQ